MLKSVSLWFLSSLANVFDQVFKVGDKLGLEISFDQFSYDHSKNSRKLRNLQLILTSATTLVCWLVALLSNPSWTELSILISLSINSLLIDDLHHMIFPIKTLDFWCKTYCIRWFPSPSVASDLRGCWTCQRSSESQSACSPPSYTYINVICSKICQNI